MHTDSGGHGDALVLIHGGGLADWFTPLAADAALARYRVIRLVRAGYTGTPAPAGLTVTDHAGHAAALLHHLNAAPAHVIAHPIVAWGLFGGGLVAIYLTPLLGLELRDSSWQAYAAATLGAVVLLLFYRMVMVRRT